jgi:hypothetical protein
VLKPLRGYSHIGVQRDEVFIIHLMHCAFEEEPTRG